MKWSRRSYLVKTSPTRPPSLEVDGLTCSVFGVHKVHRGFSLDHLPSGLRITTGKRQRDLKALAERLMPLLEDAGLARDDANTDADLELLHSTIKDTMTEFVKNNE